MRISTKTYSRLQYCHCSNGSSCGSDSLQIVYPLQQNLTTGLDITDSANILYISISPTARVLKTALKTRQLAGESGLDLAFIRHRHRCWRLARCGCYQGVLVHFNQLDLIKCFDWPVYMGTRVFKQKVPLVLPREFSLSAAQRFMAEGCHQTAGKKRFIL